MVRMVSACLVPWVSTMMAPSNGVLIALLWLRCPHCAADFGLLVTDPEGEAVYLGLGDPMTTTVE